MSKVYNRAMLDEALYKAGLTSSVSAGFQWIHAREKKGLLVSPREPSTNVRKYTLEQIKEIIQAFLPSGKGEWKYE